MNINPENIFKVQEYLKKNSSSYTYFLSEGVYKGKILLDKEGRIISDVAPYYRVPYLNNGEVSYRMVRDYPGNPIREVIKSLSEQGLLSSSGWNFDVRPVAKFLAYLHEAPPSDKNFEPGVYVVPMTAKYLINGFQAFVASIFSSAKNQEDIYKIWEAVKPYFDPASPNYGMVFNVKKGKGGTFAISTMHGIINIPPFEVPSWALESDLNQLWVPTNPDWYPTTEYKQEVERLAEGFYELAITGRLSGGKRGEATTIPTRPKGLDETLKGFPRNPMVSSPSNIPSEEELPFRSGAGYGSSVSVSQPQKANSGGVPMVKTEVVTEERFSPHDPRSGGPEAIHLDATGLPLCYGHIDTSLKKCRSCSFAKNCLQASL